MGPRFLVIGTELIVLDVWAAEQKVALTVFVFPGGRLRGVVSVMVTG